jgi:hypothetical protein
MTTDALLVFIGILLAVGLLSGLYMLIRKIQFDQVERNFRSWAADYDGQVIRSHFAATPTLKGKFLGEDLLVYLSSVREKKSVREYYATYTSGIALPFTFTITSQQWLQRHPVEQKRESDNLYFDDLRVSAAQKQTRMYFTNNKQVLASIAAIPGFVYLFSNSGGLIFECEVENRVAGASEEQARAVLNGVADFVKQIRAR